MRALDRITISLAPAAGFAALAALAALAACAHRQPDPHLARARADMEREAYVQLVPAAVADALGVPAAAAATTPFLDPLDVNAVFASRFDALLDALGPCVPAGEAAWAMVVFGADGRAGPVRAAAEPERGDAECLARVAAAWQAEGRSPAPGALFGQVLGSGARLAEPPASPAADPDAPPGGVWRRPRGDVRCVAGVVQRELARGGPVPDVTVEMRFAVHRDGSVSGLRPMTRASNRVAVAVAHGIQACPWVPGTRDGEPAGMWVIWPVRLVG
jgi:hypothetical protein